MQIPFQSDKHMKFDFIVLNFEGKGSFHED